MIEIKIIGYHITLYSGEDDKLLSAIDLDLLPVEGGHGVPVPGLPHPPHLTPALL